jgi:hypothetical protein
LNLVLPRVVVDMMSAGYMEKSAVKLMANVIENKNYISEVSQNKILWNFDVRGSGLFLAAMVSMASGLQVIVTL